jgi:hypothetical protein
VLVAAVLGAEPSAVSSRLRFWAAQEEFRILVGVIYLVPVPACRSVDTAPSNSKGNSLLVIGFFSSLPHAEFLWGDAWKASGILKK